MEYFPICDSDNLFTLFINCYKFAYLQQQDLSVTRVVYTKEKSYNVRYVLLHD